MSDHTHVHDHVCLDCVQEVNGGKRDMEKMEELKKDFQDFENITGRNWGRVDLAAQKFKMLILKSEEIGAHPEEVFPATSACNVLTSFLASGIMNANYLSEIFSAIYQCVRLSRKYHFYLYNEQRFWCILFERILSLPDVQFFEAVMLFIMVVGQIFTDQTKRLCCSRYLVTVESYYYLNGKFHPEKLFPIFKKLYEIQEKNITSNDTSFVMDYRKCVSPLFAPSVAEKEWYSLKKNSPIEFMAILIHLFLTRPIIIELLLIKSPGIPVLMSALSNESCKHMHSSIMFSLDAMLSIDNDSRYDLFLQLMKKLDFPLILNIAVYDDLHYLRALAQKVILHTLNFLETGRKAGVLFNIPRRRDLLNVEFSKLKNMISLGGLDDKIFAFVIVKERVEREREQIMEESFQDFAVCVLDTCEEKLSHCKADIREQLITVALNFLVNIGPLDDKKYSTLLNMYNVKCMSKFYKHKDSDIQLLSRACTVNLCHYSFDKKLELFKLFPLKELTNEAYELRQKYLNKEVDDLQYSQLMPLNLKLIHSEITIQYHLKATGACEKESGERKRIMDMFKPDTSGNLVVCISGENWQKMIDYVKTDGIDKSAILIDTDTTNKLMEILTSVIFEKNIPKLIHIVSVACISFLMHDGNADISRFLTPKVVSYSLGLCEGKPNTFYLSEGGDFKAVYDKTFLSQLSIKDIEEPIKKTLSKACALLTCPGNTEQITNDGNDDIKTKKMKKCGKCRNVSYCGRECQLQHWNEHKKTCKEPT